MLLIGSICAETIQFGTRVTDARFDECTSRWVIRTGSGHEVSASYFIPAVGCLSAANMPDLEGLDSFRGAWYHTAAWPHDGVDFTGKRVGIIGTGATAIQAIPM